MPREQKENLSLQEAINIIAAMQPFERNRMAAFYVAERKIRNVDYVNHDIMWALDDEWERVYQENRGRKSFGEAAIMAYQRIFGLIYGEDKYKHG